MKEIIKEYFSDKRNWVKLAIGSIIGVGIDLLMQDLVKDDKFPPETIVKRIGAFGLGFYLSEKVCDHIDNYIDMASEIIKHNRRK